MQFKANRNVKMQSSRMAVKKIAQRNAVQGL